ncbi:MAG: hypothetical protein K2Y26_11640 [Gemmatimonadaceae bacterium]|uniref:hypothetical protein n=1 Tax=Gemmatimonas sp. UBA7669 TaxID=1946568 RepID=UPI0025BC782D|nr:hypothetical protein [Gemmatimonas sp. UBA7669]MBA3920007.1 hypothetical protein [Gemmatimonas sp.]MBL0891647.1 hypothetical protein [Gemmatimonadaceae bacterium]MBX9856167.1 hypothetical protein [Gemmatimonadaceae bacterium]
MSSAKQAKSVAMMSILAAFLTGGVVGFATDRALNKPELRVYDAQEELARALEFSDAQRQRVDSIWAWRRARQRELLAPVRAQLDSTRDSARVLILKELNESQTRGFYELIERNERAADSVARVRGEKQ